MSHLAHNSAHSALASNKPETHPPDLTFDPQSVNPDSDQTLTSPLDVENPPLGVENPPLDVENSPPSVVGGTDRTPLKNSQVVNGHTFTTEERLRDARSNQLGYLEADTVGGAPDYDQTFEDSRT